jgi:predicted DNA-binding transcriptional regulator YafY
MRRADRLFQIVQLLRRQPVITAERLATELSVSVRTIYRDVGDLIATGVPITGEAGVGYALGKGYDLPPLMFDATEIEAMVLGARMVQAWSDDALARSARSVLEKVSAVVPPALAKRLAASALHAVQPWCIDDDERSHFALCRAAIEAGSRLIIVYTRADGDRRQRIVWPLGLFFWGRSWTLGAWCEIREDYRSFRLDRIASADDVGRGQQALAEPPTLAGYLRHVGASDFATGGYR